MKKKEQKSSKDEGEIIKRQTISKNEFVLSHFRRNEKIFFETSLNTYRVDIYISKKDGH